MAALEQVMQLRQQGMSERQIIDSLKSQGVTPKDINDALSQSQIKSELAPEQTFQPTQQPTDNYAQSSPSEELGMPSPQPNQMQQPTQQFQEPPAAIPPINQEPPMQQSMMSQNTMPPQPEPQQYQQPISQPPQQFQEPYPATDLQPAESPQSQEQYPEYEYQQSVDVETITEIAEQITEEKTEKIKKQIEILAKTKEDSISKIDQINKRLEKIENSFNELQMAILGKIGDYTQNLQNISQDLHATQESFSKVLNPVIDKQRKSEPNQETSSPKQKGSPKKQSEDFEKFLR